jgi:hypothetical protein
MPPCDSVAQFWRSEVARPYSSSSVQAQYTRLLDPSIPALSPNRGVRPVLVVGCRTTDRSPCNGKTIELCVCSIARVQALRE